MSKADDLREKSLKVNEEKIQLKDKSVGFAGFNHMSDSDVINCVEQFFNTSYLKLLKIHAAEFKKG